MNSPELFKYYQDLAQNDVLFFFKGALDHTAITHLGEALNEQFITDPKLQRRIISVFFELAQNVKLYSSEKIDLDPGKEGIGVGVFSFSESEDSFYMRTGNLIELSEKTYLEERCKKVNGLNRDELNDFYRKERRKALEKNKKGGNIGLIELVRKSGNPLNFEVLKFNDDQCFFSLEVRISKSLENG
jgi:hypothetical protein